VWLKSSGRRRACNREPTLVNNSWPLKQPGREHYPDRPVFPAPDRTVKVTLVSSEECLVYGTGQNAD
jgi:hypothetical protein